MANGPKPDEPTPTPEPEPTPSKQAGLDPAAIQKAVTDGLSQALTARDRAVAEAQARQQAQAQAQREARTKGDDPVRKVVLDAIGDELGNASFRADAAADLAQFYTIHPEARAHAGDIEAKFRELASEGRPMDRESIYYWYRGVNYDKFVAADRERAAREEQEARGAVGVGPGVGRLPRVMKDPYEMTSDELDQALQGQTF
jgi:hypothetical protein